MDVADEPREAQQPQQTEDLGEAHDAEGARRAVHVRRLQPGLDVHDEEDVVDGDGGDEVHHEPGAQVLGADLLGVQDYVAVLPRDPRAEVEDQVQKEEGVGDDVEGDPRRGVLVLEEGDAPGQDHQVAHHQQQHHQIPVEPMEKQGW